MSVNQKIFDKKYYYDICLGSEEFKKSGGRILDAKIKARIDQIYLTKTMNVLEIGCGRGDTALHIAEKVHSITGVDYAIEGIRIANSIRKKYPKKIQQKVHFSVMDATKLSFKTDQFDLVILIDTMDHLNRKEQERTMKEISRVLKKDGTVFIRTCTNRILLSFTYRYYIYPMNRLLTWLDKKMKGVAYASLPKDPRSKEQKIQHINESDYFSLQKLFNKYHFSSKITSEVGFLKETNGIRGTLYNFVITLYPFSQYYPLNILFTNSFICILRNQKPISSS